MANAVVFPKDFLERIGEPVARFSEVKYWRSLHLAWALGCSEQTISTWARRGMIPAGKLIGRVRYWSHEDVLQLASVKVQQPGYYAKVTKGERRRMMHETNKGVAKLRLLKLKGQ